MRPQPPARPHPPLERREQRRPASSPRTSPPPGAALAGGGSGPALQPLCARHICTHQRQLAQHPSLARVLLRSFSLSCEDPIVLGAATDLGLCMCKVHGLGAVSACPRLTWLVHNNDRFLVGSGGDTLRGSGGFDMPETATSAAAGTRQKQHHQQQQQQQRQQQRQRQLRQQQRTKRVRGAADARAAEESTARRSRSCCLRLICTTTCAASEESAKG
jgi:hypothetical protein